LSGKPPGVDVTEVTTRQLLLNFLNSYFEYIYQVGQNEPTNNWSSVVVYDIGDEVIYGGSYFVSNVENNLNVIPSAESDNWQVIGVVGYSPPRITATLETHLTYGTPNVLTLRISSPLTVESAGIYFGYNSRGPYTFGIIPPHTGPLNDAPIEPYYGLMISRGSTVVQARYPIVCD
jgi:hypothetical protein